MFLTSSYAPVHRAESSHASGRHAMGRGVFILHRAAWKDTPCHKGVTHSGYCRAYGTLHTGEKAVDRSGVALPSTTEPVLKPGHGANQQEVPMKLTAKHVSDEMLNKILAAIDLCGFFTVATTQLDKIHDCLLELKQRRAEDRAKAGENAD